MNYRYRLRFLVRIGIIGLLLLSTILDSYSFLIHPEFWTFDINPIYITTQNVFTALTVKILVIGGLTYLLLRIRNVKDHTKFLWIMMAIYLIFAQTMGFISNLQVAEQNPTQDQAPSKEVRLKTGFNFALLYAYYPILFAMISFKIFEWGWKT